MSEDKNKIPTIYKKNKKDYKQYLTLDYKIFEYNLSLDEIALLVYMLSKPPHWIFQVAQAETETQWSRRRIYGVLARLKEKGFVHLQKYQDSKGYFRTRYYVFETPDINFFDHKHNHSPNN